MDNKLEKYIRDLGFQDPAPPPVDGKLIGKVIGMIGKVLKKKANA